MIKFTPVLLAVGYGLIVYFFSARRLRKELDDQSVPLNDPVLNQLTQRLAKVVNLPSLPVFVQQVDPINGLAAPDGRIFITRGFIQKYREGRVSAEELASVIAHELGHVALGHSRRRMIDFSMNNALRAVLTMTIGRFVPIIGIYVANLLSTLLAARLSRSDEYEADAYAAAVLTKAGIGTGPQISLFEKLDALSGSIGGPPAWMRSHPKTNERVAAIADLDARWMRKGNHNLPS